MKTRKILKTLLCLLLSMTTFFAINIPIARADAVAYSQYDSRWASWTYGQGTIGGTGCGILSAVNAINYISGISNIPDAVDDIATWAHNINGYNGSTFPSGGTDRTVVYPNLESAFGDTYNFEVTNTGTWATVYSSTLKNYISQSGKAAIAHVAYGHFIVLAEYDSSDDTFLVLDSAPGDSGNTGNGVAWLSPTGLNSSGNSRMHVDWWCLLETTGPSGVAPYMENGELWLTDCNSTEGFTPMGSTEIFVENDSRGLTSMCMRNPTGCTSMAAGVGSMAILDYGSGQYANVTPFNKIRFSMWCEIDYATSSRTQDYFQVNFVTKVNGTEQDGYNLNIPASSLRQGWNNDFVFDISTIPKAVSTADWSNINRMRFTWFNVSAGASVEFNIDNFVCYYEAPPVAPYMENGELWLTDCNSTEGWSTGFNTTIFSENDSRGLTSMCITNDDNCQNNNASVGSMALMYYTDGYSADVTSYNRVRFSMWCEIDYASSSRSQDYFQVNFITEGQDGYNLVIPASSLYQGWNNDFDFALSDIPKAVNSADWSEITGMRFTWFNVSNGQGVEFNVDNFVCYYSQSGDPINPVDTSQSFVISNCDSVRNWNVYTGDDLSIDSTRKTQGSASLAAENTGGVGLYYKMPGITDFSDVDYISFDFIPAAADMAEVSDIRIVLSSRDFINEDNTNSNSWNDNFYDLNVSGFKTANLTAGEWNHIVVPVAGGTSNGNFDITKVKKIGIQLLNYYTDERPAGTINCEWLDNVQAHVE